MLLYQFRLTGIVTRPEYNNNQPASIMGCVGAESLRQAVQIAEDDGWDVTSVKKEFQLTETFSKVGFL